MQFANANSVVKYKYIINVNIALTSRFFPGRSHLADLPDRLVYQSEGILKSMLSPPRLIASVLVSSQIQHFGKILKRLEQEG